MAKTGQHIQDDEGLVVGRKPVIEMLETSPEKVEAVHIQKGLKGSAPDKILDLCKEHGIRYRLCTKEDVDRLYKGIHQGIVAQASTGEFVDLKVLLGTVREAPLPLIVALDQIKDPGNVGAIARTAYALGVAGLIMPKHHGARIGAGAFKASAGAISKLPIARVTNLGRALDDCMSDGLYIYGAGAGETSQSVYTAELHFPAVVVLGNEDKGVRQSIAERCDALLEIPMLRQFDSLNVAQAGGILISHFGARNAG